MSRPEYIAPPEVFYDALEAGKYGGNSRMIKIQTHMTERALELARVEPNSGKCILDIGCGSGISGEVLSEHGHYWVGLDISQHMLLVALERESEGDLMLSDMGQGFKFRPGSFDAAVSISAIQWLCNEDRKVETGPGGVCVGRPFNRCVRFFQSLFNCLARGARAVLQFYPDGADQIEMLTSAAMKAGFTGGVVIDYPHSTKAKKHYLVLNAGGVVGATSSSTATPSWSSAGGLQGEDGMDVDEDGSENDSDEDGNGRTSGKQETVKVEQRERQKRKKTKTGKLSSVKTKDWIVKKKEQMRSRGQVVKQDSKFTGRKRKPKF
ncbi:unnamed protein product [Amoebophrya sp. A25]|nr:unnamed protein product [Amoebophrya sp. A25]|eukprot:GSA25T00014592001.1